MVSCDIVKLYHRLFSMIVEDPRIPPKKIAKNPGKTGRGRSPSTISHHIIRMYKKKISREPIMVLKPFKDFQTTAFLAKKSDRKDIRSVFLNLYKDKRIDYVLILSGDHDFFITTRESHLNLERYGLETCERSNLYSPIFTIPRGWELSVSEALQSFKECDFSKGNIPREVNQGLEWKNIDWNIYNSMKLGIRRGFTSVAKEINEWPRTVQLHFLNTVLPSCTICHYFFPKGQDFYDQAFVRVETKYETGIVKALEMLPCTTYVFPLEEMLVLGLFHEGVRDLMDVFQKFEETGIIDSYLLYVPLVYGL